jgi:hypothetical protein
MVQSEEIAYMNTNLTYIAQTYDASAYGACAYQDQTDCNSTEVVGAPNTGFFLQPTFIIPSILGGAILIAVAILVVKKIVRKARSS